MNLKICQLNIEGISSSPDLHGIAMYAKISLADCHVTYQDHTNPVHVLTVEVNGFAIVNARTPSKNWSSVLLKVFTHSTLYAGDFNSHNQIWGYEQKNHDGNRLSEWFTLNRLIYDPNRPDGERNTLQISQLSPENLEMTKLCAFVT
jgi:hypothetical protein